MSQPTQTADGDLQRFRTGLRGLLRRFSISERADTSCCGMTVAQAATLEILAAEGPLRLGELGKRLGITASTLSRNLARLEEAGTVQRIVDPQDGRAARVALTAAGRAAAARVEEMERDFARQVLDRLPPERRRRALEGLQDLLGAVRQATESCCPGAFDHLMRDLPGGPRGDGGCCDEDR